MGTYPGLKAIAVTFVTALLALSSLTHVRSGALRPIGVTSLERLDSLTDVPTISESGVKDFEMSNNYGLFANIKVPAAVLQAVNREVSSVMNSAEMKDKLAADGAEPAKPHTPRNSGLVSKTASGNGAHSSRPTESSRNEWRCPASLHEDIPDDFRPET